nr:hypothetical protein [Paenibacillus bovis]
MKNSQTIHLLWPSDKCKEEYEASNKDIDGSFIKNLGVEQIVEEISINEKYRNEIRNLICFLCDDYTVIKYRLDILEDFLRLPGLCQRLEEVLPIMNRLKNEKIELYSLGANQFRKIAWQLDKLYIYVECIEEMKSIFREYKKDMKSDGLLRLCGYIEGISSGDTYQSLKRELPKFRNQIEEMSFVTIGINLDNTLKPVEAVFLSVESKPFKKQSVLSNFLGLKITNEDNQGISQFHSFLNKPAFEKALFDDLEDIFKASILPIGTAIRQYTKLNTEAITNLALEIGYYIGASKWIHKLTSAGLSMCKPTALPKEKRECKIKNLRDMILAMDGMHLTGVNLNEKIVSNDIEFGTQGRVYILTGPNQGGKTTYTRSIGLAQVLFQAGLYVPGSAAAISPVDWICTHFNEEETPDVNNGRLGEESQRLAEVFEKATSYSLILLNETFSSTSPGEGLYLAEDIIKGIVMVGCRTVFATHFHELAANIDVINSEFPESDTRLISMVAGVERDEDSENEAFRVKRTYKVIPSPPQGLSYAKDIARMYGISLEQITEKLQIRGRIK